MVKNSGYFVHFYLSILSKNKLDIKIKVFVYRGERGERGDEGKRGTTAVNIVQIKE